MAAPTEDLKQQLGGYSKSSRCTIRTVGTRHRPASLPREAILRLRILQRQMGDLVAERTLLVQWMK